MAVKMRREEAGARSQDGSTRTVSKILTTDYSLLILTPRLFVKMAVNRYSMVQS